MREKSLSILSKPTHPCPTCGSTNWWWRPESQWGPGEWLCEKCRPDPNKEAEVITEKEASLFDEAANILKNENVAMAEAMLPIQKEAFRIANEQKKAPPLSKTQAHIQYKLADGTVVPGVTTVLNILAKPALIQWAWELGRQNLVSEEYRYGGTLDLFAEYNGEFILVDFKTGKAIYDEQLLEEQGWPVANARILRIGRDEDEGFEEVIRTSLETEWQIFLRCLEIYWLRSG